jgi:predicted short-subunit dehydrogenase-like oxidoreductase (DUF2520 family)
MLRAVKRPSIAIVGPGRLGTALALRLSWAGYTVPEIISRKEKKSLAAAQILARKVGARASHASEARLDADLIWLCTPDSRISNVVTWLSKKSWRRRTVFHSSGVLTGDVLGPLKSKGASVASVHPLMTFVQDSVPDLCGVTFAVEGDARAVRVARRIVGDLKGEIIRLRKQDKVAYHAFATMICPLLVSLLGSAEQVAGLAGISRKQARRRMLPIVHQTLRNYAKLGPAKAFSGPIVRGDVQTIQQHLRVLLRTRRAREAYLALARAALQHLPSRRLTEINAVLKQAREISSA